MMFSARSFLTAGVAVVGASAIAISPAVQPLPAPPPPVPTVQLAAQVRPLADITDLISTLGARHLAVAPAASAPSPGVSAAAAPALTGIGSNIIPIYNAVQPWVAWGVAVTAWAVGWVPVVGWIAAPQINIVYGSLVQPIVGSVVYNTAYLLQGSVNLGQALVNVGTDTVNAFGGLANAEINWLLSFLPPFPPISLPPFPPLPGALAAQQATFSATAAPEQTVVKQDPTATIADAVAAVQAHVAARTGLTKKVLDTAVDAVTTAAQDVSATIQEKVPGTVAAVREFNTAHIPVVKSLRAAPRTIAAGVVAAQGEVRDAAVKAATDVADAAATGNRKAVRDAVAATPTTLAKGFSGAKRTVTGSVVKAAHDSQAPEK
jgi:hypothetical protein